MARRWSRPAHLPAVVAEAGNGKNHLAHFPATRNAIFPYTRLEKKALAYLFCNLLPVNQLTNQPVNNPAVGLLKIGQFEFHCPYLLLPRLEQPRHPEIGYPFNKPSHATGLLFVAWLSGTDQCYPRKISAQSLGIPSKRRYSRSFCVATNEEIWEN